MYNNFIIVGLGSSGSQFLAHTMNLSKKWTVTHEGCRKPTFEENQELLNRNFYGDVNGFLRYDLNRFKARKKGLILRNPRDMFLSWWEHREGKFDVYFYRETYQSLKLFDKYIEQKDILKIFFKEMTENIGYLQSILNYFGVKDVIITEEIIKKKINQHRKFTLKSFDDIPIHDREMYIQLTDWFLIKHKKYFNE